MRTSKASVEVEERDYELENRIGNLLVAEYQVDRLRNRLVEKISLAHQNAQSKDCSAYSFKFGSKWYRVHVKVEEEKEILGAAAKEEEKT